jgi:hypothetical protein
VGAASANVPSARRDVTFMIVIWRRGRWEGLEVRSIDETCATPSYHISFGFWGTRLISSMRIK